MKKTKYTIQEADLLSHVQQKVADLFKKHPVPSHGIEHISRVVGWARHIALAEKAKSVFLCELSAWLHDIGRTQESKEVPTRDHAEFSYKMLRRWFKNDNKFGFLTDEQKKELLYAVRYHWNNEANDYDTAWILRDADKLDALGDVGLNRTLLAYEDDPETLGSVFRMYPDMAAHVRTKTAKKIVKKNHLLDPIYKKYKEFLRSKIEPVEL